MAKLLAQVVLKITPELARRFADMEPCPNDRKLQEWRKRSIREVIEKGEEHAFHWVVANFKGREYRINGKHSSTVLTEMNGTMPNDLVALVETFEVLSMEQMATLYSQYDKTSSARSAGDLYDVYRATSTELIQLPPNATKLAGAAYNYVCSFVDQGVCNFPLEHQPDAGARGAWVAENSDFARLVAELCLDKTGKHLRRGPVCAAMLMTFKKAPSAARLFWAAVKSGDAPAEGPARRLERLLLDIKTTKNRNLKRKNDARALLSRCIHAWNAFRQNRKTDLKYHADSKVPGAI